MDAEASQEPLSCRLKVKKQKEEEIQDFPQTSPEASPPIPVRTWRLLNNLQAIMYWGRLNKDQSNAQGYSMRTSDPLNISSAFSGVSTDWQQLRRVAGEGGDFQGIALKALPSLDLHHRNQVLCPLVCDLPLEPQTHSTTTTPFSSSTQGMMWICFRSTSESTKSGHYSRLVRLQRGMNEMSAELA